MAFPTWVPSDVVKQAERLSLVEAQEIFAPWLSLGSRKAKGAREGKR
jgi:hypothetical protein